MQGNLVFFSGIVLFVFLIWVAAGGPLKSGVAGPSLLVASTTLGAGSTTPSERASARELARIQDEVVDLQRSAVAASRFGAPSPYKDLVSLSLGTISGSNEPDKEYLSLSVSSRADGPVDITGWRIASAVRGASLSIPTGVNLPRSARVNLEEAIRLNPGDRAYLVVGDSPVGMSFRENRCTGYFDQFQIFSPSLSHQCPYALDDMDRFYYGSSRTLDACRAYLSKVPRCEVPRNLPASTGDECAAFAESHLDYNGCVDAHLGDRDFFTETWRIYLGERHEFFTAEHDTVKLLDAEGKTVDLISY